MKSSTHIAASGLKVFLFFALFLALGVISPKAHSAAISGGANAELARIIERVEARYDTLQSVSADFTQEVKSMGMPVPMRSGGRVWFKKPGMMRWVYSAGTTDELIGNLQSVWLYQPELNQVIQTDASRVQSVATDFLTGVGRLSNDFDVSLLSKSESVYSLLLIPKIETAGVSRLILEVGAEDYVVVRTTVEDAFGTTTTVTFSQLRFGELKKDSFFSFVPPAEINILTQ